MRTLLSILLVAFLSIPAFGQKVSDLPPTYVIHTSDLFMVTTPNVANYKATFLALASNLSGMITVAATVTNAVASGSNLAVTNSTSFGLFYQVQNFTNMQFFNLKQGTNVVLYRDGSNVVVNGSAVSGGVGAGNAGQTIVLDSTFGNDSTATRTNTAKPFVTASNAVSAIQSGDTLVIRGGTNLVNPKISSGSAENYNGALAITNKNNIRITGEPGAFLQMSSRSTNYGASSASMFSIVGCTNVMIDNLNLVGFLTNGVTGQDFAICLINCANVTIDGVIFENWQDQGITDNGGGTCINRYITIQNCEFRRIGGITHHSLTDDGTAISVNASDLFIRNNIFKGNLRDWELYSQGTTIPAVSNLWFTGNTIDQTREKSVFFVVTNQALPGVKGVVIENNTFRGYATNAYPSIATAIHIYSVSNMVIRGNSFSGYDVGIIYGYGGTPPNSVFVDVEIEDNVFKDNTIHGVYIMRQYTTALTDPLATLERVNIIGNEFRSLPWSAIAFNANNGRIEGNTVVDCTTADTNVGVIMIGNVTSGVASNSTNITIVGNKIYSQAFFGSSATGIVNTANSYSNVIWGNEVSRYYHGDVHDSGTMTRREPLNGFATNALLRSDNFGRMGTVTIGTNIIWDGTTLSSSGTGGGAGLVTNDNQFGTSPTLTIKGGALLTNLNIRTASGAAATALTVDTNFVVKLGNVGIGTTNPSSSLDATGEVRAATAIFTNLVTTLRMDVTTLNVSTIVLTNAITLYSFGLTATNISPGVPSATGAMLWSDGTNAVVTLRNSAGGITTNKLSMAAWP